MSKKKNQSINKEANKLHKWYPVIALIITAVVYAGSLSNGFVNWDDPANFLKNPQLLNKNFLQSIAGIFSNDVIGNYNPLSTASYWIDKTLFGFNNPAGWHGINLMLHLGCVFLLYKLVLRLGMSSWVALIVAVLFGIHPMHVESVAWVTERKDVLFTLFYLLALLYYVKNKSQPTRKNQTLIIVFFVLSLFSKIQAVSLPLSMLAIDFLLQGKWSIKDWTSKWYYFLMSLAMGCIGFLVLSGAGSLVGSESSYNFIERMSVGSVTLVTYFAKLFVPYKLSAYYMAPESIPGSFYAALLILPLLLGALWVLYKRKANILFFGLFFFLVNVVFVAQFIPAGQGYLADRFTYVSYIGLFVIVAHYLVQWKSKKNLSTPIYVLLGIGLIAFSYISSQQIPTWKDGAALWTNAIEANPNSLRAYVARGNFFYRKGDLQKALSDYDKGLSIKENDEIYANRAKVYLQLYNNDKGVTLAMADLNKAISINPNVAEYYSNRAAAFGRQNDVNMVMKDLNTAIRLDPNFAENYFNRAKMFGALGELSNAVNDLNRAISINPSSCAYINVRATLKGQMGDGQGKESDLKMLRLLGCR